MTEPKYDEILKAAQAANECDRSSVADALSKIEAAIDGYRWATEGRGSYAWNDDRYRNEFKNALDEIATAAAPLREIAGDRDHCPTLWSEIRAARCRER